MIRPTKNPLSRGYTTTHKGYDFRGLDLPDEVVASASGVIEQRVDLYSTNWINTGTLTTKDYGNYIKIKHDDGSYELHAHLRQGSALNLGTRIGSGQIIARIGNTGNSTGPHLHSEYRNSSNINIEVTFEEVNMAEIDDLRIQVTNLQKEVEEKNIQIGNYANQVKGLEQKCKDEYARGFNEGKAFVSPVIGWEENGLTIETTNGNEKRIINYKRKV